MLNNLYGETISMKGSILGFPQLNTFVLLPVDEANPSLPFAYLQSTEENGVGFMVAYPFSFAPTYELQVQEDEKAALNISEPNEVIVLSIVTIADPFDQSTLNLLAPLLINVANMNGKQIVLPPDTQYSTRTPLFSSSSEQEEGSPC